jgi:predicted HTH transcriptional regulator
MKNKPEIKSEFIQKNLERIKHALESEEFIDLEQAKIELKDLSTGTNWHSLKQSICAFLNTEGGIVFCGIRERNKKYHLTGFDRKNEGNVLKLQNESFKDDRGLVLDLSDYIYFDYTPLGDKEILYIAVYPLPDDQKYVSFDGVYYERKLTGDKEIPISKIQQQKEYKLELEYAKEIALIDGASLADLDLNKINRYVDLLNREIRKESFKTSLEEAKPFLARQHFLRDGQVSTLGLLVCGEEPEHFLGERCEVNCYYDPQSQIAKDKKIFRNDVISLMDDAFRYIWHHILVGRSVQQGGRTEPEYPETLIREAINNALAHRDYTINRFITISIQPGHSVEISNPGAFKATMKLVHREGEIPVYRLIPGIPESKNPKLASVLKVFDKIESQGRGMAYLVNAALENLVDLPYYEIKEQSIKLVIRTGQLVDESIEDWLKGFGYYIQQHLKTPLNKEQQALLAYFYKAEQLDAKRYFTILLSESNNHFDALQALKKAGLILEHPASTELTPVYVLDRTLSKTNFQEELAKLIGWEYLQNELSNLLLNILYRFSKYNNQGLKPAELTPQIYRHLHGKIIEAKRYETLGRKVRALCSQLQEAGILFKENNNAYSINFQYKKHRNLFDPE